MNRRRITRVFTALAAAAIGLVFAGVTLARSKEPAPSKPAPPAAQAPAAPDAPDAPVPPEPPDLPTPPDIPGTQAPRVPGAPKPPRIPGNMEFGRNVTIRPGETYEGDLYRIAETVDVAGKLHGDLFAISRTLNVTGEVTGDLLYMGQSATLGGRVGDSVRIWGQTILVQGVVHGDMLVVGQSVDIAPGARIEGDLSAYGAQLTMNGTVTGQLLTKSGRVSLGGHVAGDSEITCDQLEVLPEARVGGDLTYESRNEVQIPKDVVKGQTSFEEKKEEEKEEKTAERTPSSHLPKWRIFSFLSSLLLGYAALALFPGVCRAIVRTIETDALRTTGIGFLGIVVIPFAAVLSCILIITIPLAAIVLVLYVFGIYLAKLPVASWLGGWLLRRIGRADPSPYLGLTIGLLLLHLVFAIPYLGCLVWCGCVLVGAGAMGLGTAAHVRIRRGPLAPPAPAGPPSVPPPPPIPPPGPITFGSQP